MFADLYGKTHETFFKEWVRCEDGCYKAEPVFRRSGSDEVMTLDEFNEYYKANESDTHHIIIF